LQAANAPRAKIALVATRRLRALGVSTALLHRASKATTASL